MNSRHILLAGVLSIGLTSSMAMAKDETNAYFNTNTPIYSQGVTLEGSRRARRTVVMEGAEDSLVERTVSSPVVLERRSNPPVVIEDRIIKQKHFFKLGIWPLFDFEIL
ncbi:MAG: hypothetical protein DKT66_27020 [Candidatus Melainabacteria bacterium]|nr:MAG: hypothetical protein DKT66_27020 [Candidatus Melainabacteria bacterium]